MAHQLAFEVYGVRARVDTSSADLLDAVRAHLPPVWTPCQVRDGDPHYTIKRIEGAAYLAAVDGREIASGTLEAVMRTFDTKLRSRIARRAPETVFVHAGVVGFAGVAILIPGLSESGKTTLVAALVRAGAAYLSDEFAVLDLNGLVHPYPKLLSIRGEDGIRRELDVAEIGGTIAAKPLRAGLIVACRYEPGARWEPRQVSPGEAMLELLRHAVPTQQRPAQTLAAIRRAVEGAIAVEGPRGEADKTAVQLLHETARSAAGPVAA